MEQQKQRTDIGQDVGIEGREIHASPNSTAGDYHTAICRGGHSSIQQMHVGRAQVSAQGTLDWFQSIR